jgi:hypothetical protein
VKPTEREIEMPKYKAKRTRKDSRTPRTYRGKKVIDSKQPLTFVVSEGDVRKSTPNSPEECAGACAIKRLNPNVEAVHMHRSITLVEFSDRVIRYQTPSPVRDQLLRFDAAQKFEPGPYYISKMSEYRIQQRGKQHSPPDRARGAPNSPKKRSRPLSLGRADFHFTSTV